MLTNACIAMAHYFPINSAIAGGMRVIILGATFAYSLTARSPTSLLETFVSMKLLYTHQISYRKPLTSCVFPLSKCDLRYIWYLYRSWGGR